MQVGAIYSTRCYVLTWSLVLQSFFQSLSSEGKLRGVPEKIKSIKELTEICTNVRQ